MPVRVRRRWTVADYLVNQEGRELQRAAIRARLIAEAERQTVIQGRSMLCAAAVRHDTCVGALHCLCECHDPSAVTTTPPESLGTT
jgi:hypothetical protein